MAEALEDLNFDIILRNDMGDVETKKVIDEFGERLSSYDVGLFYYAGHGIQVEGENYIVPVNAKLKSPKDVEYECVSIGRVLTKLESSKTETNIIILDACRNNPFERSWRRSSRSIGLAFIDAPSGSIIAYSTAPGTSALDGDGINSQYTEALLKHISTPNITIDEMFRRINRDVQDKTDRFQTPWVSTNISHRFYFNKITE